MAAYRRRRRPSGPDIEYEEFIAGDWHPIAPDVRVEEVYITYVDSIIDSLVNDIMVAAREMSDEADCLNFVSQRIGSSCAAFYYKYPELDIDFIEPRLLGVLIAKVVNGLNGVRGNPMIATIVDKLKEVRDTRGGDVARKIYEALRVSEGASGGPGSESLESRYPAHCPTTATLRMLSRLLDQL
jgi:hypothetical protein